MNKHLFLLFFSFFSFCFSQSKDQLIQPNFEFQQISEWENGMEFSVEKKSGYFSTTKKIKIFHPKGRGKEVSLSDFEGKIITFKRNEERTVKCPEKNCKSIFSIFEIDNQEYEFNEYSGSLEKMKNDSTSISLYSLVFYEDYKKAKNLLLNKEFHLIKNIGTDYFREKNHLVTITAIELNDSENPVKMFYEYNESGRKGEVELRLSGSNSKYPCLSKSAFSKSICDFDEYFESKTKYLKRKESAQLEIEKDLLIKEKEKKEKLVQEKKTIEDNWNKVKSECDYEKNEIDEFSGVKNIITGLYNLNESNTYTLGETNIILQKKGNSKYINFYTDNDLGCASSYSNNKSFVKVKLENDVIVSFYHIGDIDCGNFNLIAKLTSKDIEKLKQSPIKTIRFSGTKYNHDVKSIKWKTFFIDKLDCIK